jgi:aminopeptidase N
MADYLALIAIGHFTVRTGRTPGGIEEIAADTAGAEPGWRPAEPPPARRDVDLLFAQTASATDWAVKTFGPFPFSSTGGIVTRTGMNYALETQTRPVYNFHPDDPTVVHELAHQWFGDSVSVASWKDIWLNEGFATYAEWLWSEQHGGLSAQGYFERAYATPAGSAVWRIPPGDPGRDHMFDEFPVYVRGAMALQALRNTVGDPAFFRILRTWPARHRDGSASTSDFRAMAEEVSGRSLGPLLHTWLYSPAKPAR